MGGKTAMAKFKTQSATGTSTGADYDRMAKMRKVLQNMILMNTILALAGLYSLYISWTRFTCYMYYSPGSSFWYVIASKLDFFFKFN